MYYVVFRRHVGQLDADSFEVPSTVSFQLEYLQS